MNSKERLVLVFLAGALAVGVTVTLVRSYRNRQQLKVLAAQFASARGADARGEVAEADRVRPPDRTVNINTATPEELDRLPGIGPALARRIIEYRTRTGGFRKKDDLLSVSGIGPKKLAQLEDRIKVE